MYTAYVMILGILFWVLAGCAVVSLMAWVYTQVMYYRWNREDREKATLVVQVQEAVNDKIEEIRQDDENNC